MNTNNSNNNPVYNAFTTLTTKIQEGAEQVVADVRGEKADTPKIHPSSSITRKVTLQTKSLANAATRKRFPISMFDEPGAEISKDETSDADVNNNTDNNKSMWQSIKEVVVPEKTKQDTSLSSDEPVDDYGAEISKDETSDTDANNNKNNKSMWQSIKDVVVPEVSNKIKSPSPTKSMNVLESIASVFVSGVSSQLKPPTDETIQQLLHQINVDKETIKNISLKDVESIKGTYTYKQIQFHNSLSNT